jgi:hypothetical protein
MLPMLMREIRQLIVTVKITALRGMSQPVGT